MPKCQCEKQLILFSFSFKNHNSFDEALKFVFAHSNLIPLYLQRFQLFLKSNT
jgi:hypothetical protein